jgi:hypothetical protein
MAVDRRRAIKWLLAGAAAPAWGNELLAEDKISNTVASAAVQMTVTEQLMYITSRISETVAGNTRWGTGFFYDFFVTAESKVPAIITNKHVLAPLKSCEFSLAQMKADGTPELASHLKVEIPDVNAAAIYHPDVDLAIIPIGPILQRFADAGTPAFVRSLSSPLAATETDLQDLLPVEQILTVGFPGQLWDDVHNLPVFHRGYTATAPYIAFKGNREFLVDIAIWPGASGSPVFLYNESSYMDRKGSTIMGGVRIKLIGIAYGVAVQDVSGNVAIQAGPTTVAAAGSMAVPTNLGACIAATRIREFETLLIAKGAKPPPGYAPPP